MKRIFGLVEVGIRLGIFDDKWREFIPAAVITDGFSDVAEGSAPPAGVCS